jgi:ActR/RegA family two-component response regulator
VDALMNGELGLLVNPEDVDEIQNAIQKSLLNNQSRFTERRKMINNFGYEQYKQKLETILLN